MTSRRWTGAGKTMHVASRVGVGNYRRARGRSTPSRSRCSKVRRNVHERRQETTTGRVTVQPRQPMTPIADTIRPGHHRRVPAHTGTRVGAADTVTLTIDCFSIDPPIAGGGTAGDRRRLVGGAGGTSRRRGRTARAGGWLETSGDPSPLTLSPHAGRRGSDCFGLRGRVCRCAARGSRIRSCHSKHAHAHARRSPLSHLLPLPAGLGASFSSRSAVTRNSGAVTS
jgi:hypothetical protein